MTMTTTTASLLEGGVAEASLCSATGCHCHVGKRVRREGAKIGERTNTMLGIVQASTRGKKKVIIVKVGGEGGQV